MKKYACHSLLLPAGRCLSPGVVTLAPDGTLAECRALTAEEPFTEWRGGVFVVLPAGQRPETCVPALPAFLAGLPPLAPAGRYVVWQAVGQPLHRRDDFSGARFERLG